MKYLYLIPMLIPMPFIIHYYKASQFPADGDFMSGWTLLFVMMTGLLSIKLKWYHIPLVNVFSIGLSVVLAKVFITSPNGAWFKPFGMTSAVLSVGVVIVIGQLIVRFLFNRYFRCKRLEENYAR